MHKALREALANCLVNTDFYLPRAVVIKMEPGKIIMENPGSVRTGKMQMLKGGISDPRNKILMKMFNLINIGERAGSGVPDIYSVWEEENWQKPSVEEQYDPDRTILTLPLIKKVTKKSDEKKVTKKTQEQCELIIGFMMPEIEYKLGEISKVLENQDKIESVGITKGKTYRLKKEV